MLSVTVPEPLKDIQAQIDALMDPNHPKRAVFIPSSNAIVVSRQEGTLITTNFPLAEMFATVGALTDDLVGLILDYPCKKRDAIAAGDGVILQVRDGNGAVVIECCVSVSRLQEAKNHFEMHGPFNGTMVVLSPDEVIKRRMAEI